MTRSFIKNAALGGIFCLFCNCNLYAQTADTTQYKKVVAGKEYQKSRFYQSLWGKHYRKEWTTPVLVKIAMLDTLAGGLIPYEIGGSRQTRSVKLRDKNNREYVLRSIDKSFSSILPEVTKGSIVEEVTNDQVSIAHPYAAVTIAPMAEAIGVFHTNPEIYFIPRQSSLGKFNDSIGDNLYLFEQRPDENWSTAANFGNATDIKSTDKMLEKTLSDNDKKADQEAFLRARLFDMIIGDWGRHEDQWRWAEFKTGKKTVYKPIPRDRDQAFTIFDGYLVKSAKRAARINHLQTFTADISNINTFNFPARNLDRHLLNELSLDKWQLTAAEIKEQLTDNVIDNAIKKLPPEIYNISGPAIAAKIKARRNNLGKYAEEYYMVLAASVDITGTSGPEFFEINRINDDSTVVNIYAKSKKGDTKEIPFYSRTFLKKDTKEVRLYGMDGQDEYLLKGNVKRGISIRLIGGNDKDEFVDSSNVSGHSHKTEIYDNGKNDFVTSRETSLHISSDPAIHDFKYKAYKFDKRGFKPTAFFSNEDRFFIGVNYLTTKNKWRKEPYGYTRYFDVKYSLSQKAFSGTYRSQYTSLIGKWDALFFGNYDFIRWTNFFGLGNESKLLTTDRDFNRMRSSNYMLSAGLQRSFRNQHKIIFNGFYQGIDIRNDSSRFVAKSVNTGLPDFYKNNDFAGISVAYIYQKLNDSVLPRKGISLLLNGTYTDNLKNSRNNFARFSAEANMYFPVSNKLGVVVKAAAATLAGTPLFYQYNNIGGSETLRGHRRERFYGNSTVYTQNELQWISPVHSRIYNGKIGFFGLLDVGRVWLKNEQSNKWHNGYGAGIILSPYNLISASISYAISSEDRNIHIQLIKAF